MPEVWNMMSAARRWLAALGSMLVLAASGCSSGGSSPSPSSANGGSSSVAAAALFEACSPSRACESGLECITANGTARCQHLCQSDADCNFTIRLIVDDVPATCGTLTREVKACTLPCSERYGRDFACIDGHPVECSALDEKSCSICGCADERLRCEPNVGCHPKRAVDEACTANSDCATDNCDQYAHVCRVAVGSACTPTNCERCIAWQHGTYCSRTCLGNEQCNGGGCLFQACHPACAGPVDAGCPGECQLFLHAAGPGVPDEYACVCDAGKCGVLFPPGDVGSDCNEDTDCGDDGVCLHNHPLELERGVCSRHCSTAKPCSAGRSCVNVPCGEGEPNTCGPLCLNDCAAAEPRCREGTCRSLPDLDAQAREVCDFRKPAGEFCNAHNDCVSTRCVDGKCAEAAP
jgi:hypothetical protein